MQGLRFSARSPISAPHHWDSFTKSIRYKIYSKQPSWHHSIHITSAAHRLHSQSAAGSNHRVAVSLPKHCLKKSLNKAEASLRLPMSFSRVPLYSGTRTTPTHWTQCKADLGVERTRVKIWIFRFDHLKSGTDALWKNTATVRLTGQQCETQPQQHWFTGLSLEVTPNNVSSFEGLANVERNWKER